MRMQVILDSSFARPGSAPIWGGKKGEFRDWTIYYLETPTMGKHTYKKKNNNNFARKNGRLPVPTRK